jgi:hypothetical protein
MTKPSFNFFFCGLSEVFQSHTDDAHERSREVEMNKKNKIKIFFVLES